MTIKSKIFGVVLLATALAACSDAKDGGAVASGDGGTGASSSGGGATASAKRGTVKVSKPSGAVVEYTSIGVEGNIDGDQLYFELNSPDTKQVLHLTLQARAPGTYDIAPTAVTGKATILFFTDDKLPNASTANPAEWSPPSGTLTLDTATDKQAKGSFVAKGTPTGQAEEFTIEGTFDVPLNVL